MKGALAPEQRASRWMGPEAASRSPVEAFPHGIVKYVHFLQVPKSRKRSFWDDLKLGEDKPPEKRVDTKYHSLSIH